MRILAAGLVGAMVGAAVSAALVGGSEGVEAAAPAAERPVARAATPPPPASAPVAERVAWLQGENARLQAALAEAELSGAVARGQVAQAQGTAVQWPAQVPDGFAPATFEANLRAAAATVPGLQVEEVDCSEFPCIAVLTTATDAPELQDQLKGFGQKLAGDEDHGLWLAVSRSDDGTQASTAVGVALVPEGGQQDPDLSTRVNWRADSLMRGVHEGG